MGHERHRNLADQETEPKKETENTQQATGIPRERRDRAQVDEAARDCFFADERSAVEGALETGQVHKWMCFRTPSKHSVHRPQGAWCKCACACVSVCV